MKLFSAMRRESGGPTRTFLGRSFERRCPGPNTRRSFNPTTNRAFLAPAGSDSFSGESVPGWSDGDYPPWLQAEMDWIAADVWREFGTLESTMLNGSYWKIPANKCEAVCAAFRDQGFTNLLDDSESHSLQILERCVVEMRRSRSVCCVPLRNENDHPLPRASQQHTVRVPQVISPVRLVHRLPSAGHEGVIAPIGLRVSEVGVPRNAYPIEFETLNLEFGGGILQIEA